MKESGICRPGTGTEEVIKYGAMEVFTKVTGKMIKLMGEED